MRIGLDIDNVITNFDKTILEEFKKEDKNKRNSGIVNPKGRHIEYMFDWTKEEAEEFFCNNMEKLAEILEPREDAKIYMEKLIADGHELFLISNRVYPHYKNPKEVTINWLKKYKIPYTKLILSKEADKSLECIENKIDILFDDSINNCKAVLKNGIHSCIMGTIQNKNYKSDFERVENWQELYEKVCDLAVKKMPKLHVILDTDIDNEVDDCFALDYVLNSNDRLILDAVTIAPFYHENDISIEEGIENSENICKSIFNFNHIDSTNMIYKGSTDYFKNGYRRETAAIKRMVEVINKNELTYILSIGAITNIAVLLYLHPELKNKIKIVWLGGHSIMSLKNDEYNFKQDVGAVEYVYNSKVDLTVIPCYGVASNLMTSIEELSSYLDLNSKIGKYLYKRFYNDGKHGITKRRVIWDISVIAYMINPYWFDFRIMNIPKINDDLSYDFSKETNHKIKFAVGLKQNKIFYDLFKKINR